MRIRYTPVLAAAVMLAGCVPTPPTVTIATSATTPIVGHYLCPVDGFVTIARTDTTVVLTTAFGSETFTGGLPTYYGEEASLTFGPGQNVMVWASLGEQQSCASQGLG